MVVAGLSIAMVAIGLFAGYRVYQRWREPDPLVALGGAYTLLENKYYLDDFYLKGIVRPIQYQLSAAVDSFNRVVLDGAVHAFANLARNLSGVIEIVDRRGVDGAVNSVAETAGVFGSWLRYLQTGNVQRYAVYMFAGVAIIAFVFTRI